MLFRSYSVRGALKKLSNTNVDFYWDVIGDQWDVPILNATADIWLPSKFLSTNCTYGPAGSLTQCKDTSEPDALHYQVDGLLANEAMTIATQLPASAFTSFTAPTIRDKPDPVAEFFAAAPKGLGLGLAFAIPIIWWSRKRARETVTAPIREFVRFEIPHNLTPAEMAAAWHGTLDTRAFTATMLDLAARGIVTLTLNDDEDLVITRADPTKAMAAWEAQLLNAVLGEQFSVTLSGYQEQIAAAVKAVEKAGPTSETEGLRIGMAAIRPGSGEVVAVYGGPDFATEPLNNATQAIAQAVAQAQGRDVVLVAGKGHEDYQEIQGVRHAFSDLSVAAAALKARARA